jgi:hypothetical protein
MQVLAVNYRGSSGPGPEILAFDLSLIGDITKLKILLAGIDHAIAMGCRRPGSFRVWADGAMAAS